MRRLPSLVPVAVAALLVGGLLPLAARAPSARAATTFTVTTADDPPEGSLCGAGAPCSLRAAIERANATAGRDTIRFAIPGTGLHSIRPTSVHGSLPTIFQPVTIDGYSQPGPAPTPPPSAPTPCCASSWTAAAPWTAAW